MQFFIQSLMIFFGTLMAAALVALSEPAGPELALVKATVPQADSMQQRQSPASRRSQGEWSATAGAPGMR
jgi:hypothetical protein